MPERPKRWYPNLADVAHPEVENAVRLILDKVYAERELTQGLEARISSKIRGLSGAFGSQAVRAALQVGGDAPLNVEGLLGKLAQPQVGGAAVGTATPSVDDPVSQDGALFVLKPARILYYFDGASEPGTWRSLAASGVLPAGLRSAKPAAGNTGYMYFETDTGWLYYDNGTNYVYVAGIDKGTDAARLALSISVNDSGAVFYTTDTNVLWRVATGAWTQAFISLTAGIVGILAGANGGTNNGFMAFTGPTTSLKTFTLPNASATILTDNAAVTIAQGGTGAATSQAAINALSQLTTNGDLLYHNGTNSTRLPRGTTGQHLEATAASAAWTTPDGARVFHTVGQTIPDSIWTALNFNSERYDNGGMHDTVTNNTRLTIQKAGVYAIKGQASFLANATGRRAIKLIMNNTTDIAADIRPANGVGVHSMNISTIYAFTATQYVELSVFQESTANLDIQVSANFTPEFAIQWLGP